MLVSDFHTSDEDDDDAGTTATAKIETLLKEPAAEAAKNNKAIKDKETDLGALNVNPPNWVQKSVHPNPGHYSI